MAHTRTIASETELAAFAKELMKTLRRGADDGATVLALHGELGAGKTTFVQRLGEQLGVEETITSPTFVIMKHYATSDPQFATLTHIDAYRVEEESEIEVLDVRELFLDTDRLICIEWAERIGSLLPSSTVHLTFTLGKHEERTLTLEGIDIIDK